jgi:anti-sigma B factor antagonist
MGTEGQLTIAARERGDRIVLALEGELDLANASGLESAIASSAVQASPMLVLDLERLDFIDSTGLRVILAAADAAAARGQRFALTPGSEQVQRLLSVTGASKRLATIAPAGDVPA